MKDYDVIIIGGGAAGLMCAIAAGARGRSTLVLEGANKIAKKILMSGGGRCNFTNLYCDPAHFISANPNFCISALSRYTQWDFIALVEKHGIAYHEKTAGQLFCDHSSKDIVAMLVAECDQVRASILKNINVAGVTYQDGGYAVQTDDRLYRSESLVIATGGLSIPKMGATDFGYRLASQFGLKVLPTRAGLVPFTFSGAMHETTQRLSGVSLPAVLGVDGQSFSESILFTHRGLSGPAALQLSSYWVPGEMISLNVLPQLDAAAALLEAKSMQPRSLLRTVLSEWLPRALVIELQEQLWHQYAETALAELPNDLLTDIAGHLNCWQLKPAGTEGYRTAEVTLGGIDTDELSSKTMESKQRPGLYCIGEAVDVTGHLGGFNFQWAWASAQAAGQVA